MTSAVVLFTRDLRVHDQPALAAAAAGAQRVAPLFVLDDGVLGRFGAPNRLAVLVDALAALDEALRGLGARLVVRRGDAAEQAARLAEEIGAGTVHVSGDVSASARTRERRLGAALAAGRRDLVVHPGVTVVPPGELRPAGGDHYRVFTPYWRRWRDAVRRPQAAVPARLVLPPGVAAGRIPALGRLTGGRPSPDLAPGGEAVARRRMRDWLARSLGGYDDRHDDLAGDATSRLSAHLHFGCLSPLELADRADGLPGAEPFLRQLCWRDFFHQVLAARPDYPREDYRARERRWRTGGEAEEALAAWTEGRTGWPIVDAAMRQLVRQGFVHNRARLIAAGWLTRTVGVDWRSGARHYWEVLADGDLASNAGNWQWVAGTGNDPRPGRGFNALRQARRVDPHGTYVRRHVPELAGLAGPTVHEPWRLPAGERRRLDYPPPLALEGRAR